MYQSHLIPTYTPEPNAQGGIARPSPSASACTYYATDHRGERWVIKVNPEFVLSPQFDFEAFRRAKKAAVLFPVPPASPSDRSPACRRTKRAAAGHPAGPRARFRPWPAPRPVHE